MKPFFTISLDFELMWGMYDLLTKQQYGKNILGGRSAIPKILQLFKKYNIYSILGDSSLARGKNIIDDRTPILFKPSLIITEKEINYFFNSLEKVLSSNQNILVLKFLKNVIKNL